MSLCYDTRNTRFWGISWCLYVITQNTRFGGINGCFCVMTQNTRFGGINGCLCVKTENTRFGGISGCLYVMTHRTHSSVRYVPMTHTPHSSVRYVPTAVCLCRILSRVWRRNRKGTKLTRTVLLFILRPNASFAVPPSYTLVCALVTVSVCPPLDVCSAFIHSRLCLGNGFCMPSVGCLFRLHTLSSVPW